MFDPILLVALLTTVLLGGALVRVRRSERRRADLEPLLSTIARTASGADVQGFSLRRVGRQRSAVPALLSSRLDLAFASTGNRIGPAHLVAVGIAGVAIIGLVSVAASVHPILAIALGGAAAAGAPALLLPRPARDGVQRLDLHQPRLAERGKLDGSSWPTSSVSTTSTGAARRRRSLTPCRSRSTTR